jgi:tellurite resistance protein
MERTMAFSVESPAEAYAAVSLLVAGSDGVGTLEERQILFEKLGEATVFSGYDSERLDALFGTLNARMYDNLPNDGVGLTDDAIDILCASARAQLDLGQCSDLFALAANVACCDAIEENERAMLARIAAALGIEVDAAQKIVDQAVNA